MSGPDSAQPVEPTSDERRAHISRIVKGYPSALLRAYCRIRFLIIGRRFLDVMDQYLPGRGDVLDIGCGFGLVGLYFAGLHPDRTVHAYDLDAKRVETAGSVAEMLGVGNAHFAHGDAADLTLERQFDAAYAIDIIHHLPHDAVPVFLRKIYDRLQPGGRFIIKDVDNSPAYKRWVSLITDWVMAGWSDPIYYWPPDELRPVLQEVGFTVYTHPMPDILPYPHVLYVCEK